MRGPALSGLVRLGLPQDFAETWLPDLLGRFAGQHPAVRVEVLVDTNIALLAALGAGRLDLALTWETGFRLGRPGAGAPRPADDLDRAARRLRSR